MKSDGDQAGRLEMLRLRQGDPAFDRPALLAKEAGLVRNAQEAVQRLDGIEDTVLPVRPIPERPYLVRKLTRIGMRIQFNRRHFANFSPKETVFASCFFSLASSATDQNARSHMSQDL